MFGVPIRTVLNSDCLLTGALDQAFTLLLGLLAILKSVLMQTFRFGLCFLLQTNTFLTDLLEFLQGLLAVAFVLFTELALQLNRFLIKLLTALKRFLLQLLAPGGMLLLDCDSLVCISWSIWAAC